MKAKLSKEKDWYDLYRIDEDGKKVTFASTQDYKQKLSLKNCQAIERGYDLDELAEEHVVSEENITPEVKRWLIISFKLGFQKALELMGDKKFTEEEVRKAMDRVWEWYNDEEDVDCPSIKDLKNKHIQSLQQNEWEVEIEMICPHPSDTYRCGIQYGCDEDGCNHPNQVPYLDADGCLILKRVV